MFLHYTTKNNNTRRSTEIAYSESRLMRYIRDIKTNKKTLYYNKSRLYLNLYLPKDLVNYIII